jgi:hypothetical protein
MLPEEQRKSNTSHRSYGVVLHNRPLPDDRAKKFLLQCFYSPNKSYEANKAGFYNDIILHKK